MKMKNLIMFLCLLLSQTLMAQVNAVAVNMIDGSTTEFMLANKPIITYSGNYLDIKTSNKEISVLVTSIANMSFIERSIITKIESATTTERILFQQLSVGSDVRVFTIDGKSVCTQKADSNGGVALDLSRLPKGVLIINTPTTTIKVNN